MSFSPPLKKKSTNQTRGGMSDSAPWPAELRLKRTIFSDTNFILNFTDTDYQSGDGIQTAIFGPVFWAAIHMVSFNYPVHPTPEQKMQYENWLRATGQVLPCRYCRENIEKNLEAAGINSTDVFASRDTFSRFCYNLHNEVNRMLGKPTHASFEEVRDIYEGFRSRCLTEEQKRVLSEEKKEFGCVAPAHDGTKGKCVISIIPRNAPCASALQVSDKCRPAS